MNKRWRWYEICGLLYYAAALTFLVIFISTSLAERETRALTAGLIVFSILLIFFIFIICKKRKGKFEGQQAQTVFKYVSGFIVLFTIILFIPTEYSDYEEFEDHVGTAKLVGKQKRYDARKQPGNEELKKMSTMIKEDVLTLTVYDICVGKISHKIHRDGPVSPNKVEIIDKKVLTRQIKDDAISLGAHVVGITRLKPQYVFTHNLEGDKIFLNQKYAIVIGVGLNYKLAGPTAPLPWEDYYSSLPDPIANALSGRVKKSKGKVPEKIVEEVRETMKFFSEGGSIVVQLAKYIRSLGYEARAHFHRWGEVQIIPLAVEAGLGELSKNGMLVNRTFGPRGSFSVITTNLPLVTDKSVDLGIREFCKVCNKCARSCPVQAIPYGDPQVVNGVLKWPLDGNKCFNYLTTHPKCLSCVASCPYNKPDYFIHQAASYMITRKSVLTNRIIVWLDDFLGYADSVMEYAQKKE